jgi:hypothetical protein
VSHSVSPSSQAPLDIVEKTLWFEQVPRTFDEGEKFLLAQGAKRLMGRVSFKAQLDPAPDHFMSLLLYSVYIAFKNGNPLYIKRAWIEMGVTDIKTGRKYIERAKELGLIGIARSDQDKRRELLFPTDRLQEMMDIELRQFAIEVQWLTIELRETHTPSRRPSVPVSPEPKKRAKKKPSR